MQWNRKDFPVQELCCCSTTSGDVADNLESCTGSYSTCNSSQEMATLEYDMFKFTKKCSRHRKNCEDHGWEKVVGNSYKFARMPGENMLI